MLVSKSAPLVEPLEKIKRSHSHRKVKTHTNSPIYPDRKLILISNPDDSLKGKIFDKLKDTHPLTDTELLRGDVPSSDATYPDYLLKSDKNTKLLKQLVQKNEFDMGQFNHMLRSIQKYKGTNTYVIEFKFPIKKNGKIKYIYPEYSITIDSDSQKKNDEENFKRGEEDDNIIGGKTRRQKGRKIRTRKYQKNRRTQKKN